MLGRGVGWGITIPFLTLNLVVGSIVEKPAWVFDHLGPREFLHLTLSFDHAVVDGAPAARFSQRLTELLQSGYGLSPTEAN
jgi:pyruvate/2-oxoglutarate dehydrogenase complex dihydrolipoamide acyltransferase (E2) component